MKYSSHQRYKTSFGLIDLLFNLLIGFVFLFIVAFILINPVSKKQIVDPKAEYIITMTWPDKDTNDVDLWVKHDRSVIVSFRAKDNGIMHLDRDDLGEDNDTIVIDGSAISLPLNQEVLSIRQKIKGHYTVSAHWYAQKGIKPLNLIPVTFELMQINPYQILSKRIIMLEAVGAERVAFQFDITEFGGLTDITTDNENWIQNHIIESTASTGPPVGMP